MSKLEDKLAASINPEPEKPATAAPKPAARSTRPAAAEKSAAAAAHSAPDLNDPKRPLHPSRIWPD